MKNIKVASFYRFINISNLKNNQQRLLKLCKDFNLLGTILLAEEGFNGSLSGSEESILEIFHWLEEEFNLTGAIQPSVRWGNVAQPPFNKMRVKIKREIVALGREDIRPYEKSGKALSPKDWNKLINNPEALIIDTRNKYEIDIGTFPGAINPQTDAFREFSDFEMKLSVSKKNKPIAMFCTGGIRCEKAASLMVELGFEDVNQLDGGILHYLEKVEEAQNQWVGECFVFDNRVAVDDEIKDGQYVQCHACRHPLSVKETLSPDYQEGISCPKCINKISESRLERFKERQKQINLAKQRGEKHIGKVLIK